MRVLAAELCNYAELVFQSQSPCGTILQTLYWMVWDRRVLRAGPIFFIGLIAASSHFVFYCFPFLSFSGLVLCDWDFPGQAMTALFNNNNNNNNYNNNNNNN